MGYAVTAPLVVAHTTNGDAYVFQGGELPDNTDAAQVKQLVDQGMVVEADFVEVEVEVVEVAVVEPPVVPPVEPPADTEPQVEPAPVTGGRGRRGSTS